ncbi:MAG: hypothetical protein A2Y56_15470 [Candidatus Aminicenantes bacterium RBG_13_63_10]|nr:MAG: hypothetical protein A2Y56_15470 [Candidatus Aminicenantes bacterium RBG_13_63_10]
MPGIEVIGRDFIEIQFEEQKDHLLRVWDERLKGVESCSAVRLQRHFCGGRWNGETQSGFTLPGVLGRSRLHPGEKVYFFPYSGRSGRLPHVGRSGLSSSPAAWG